MFLQNVDDHAIQEAFHSLLATIVSKADTVNSQTSVGDPIMRFAVNVFFITGDVLTKVETAGKIPKK